MTLLFPRLCRSCFFVLLCWWMVQAAPLYGQATWLPKGVGAQLGLCIELGSHQNRIGFVARAYSHWEHVQFNIEVAGLYNSCSLGAEERGLEGQFKFGLVGTWGKQDSLWQNPFFGATEQQTNRPYAVGYSYNLYWDTQKTSQCTGNFSVQVLPIRFLLENDFLAFLQEDKYRTGAIAIYYQRGPWQVALQQISWTADPYAKGTSTVTDDPNYTQEQAKYGYRAMEHVRYREHSAGILRLRAMYHTGWLNQTLGVALGVDAEQIRHTLQNKWVHDSFILRNPHIPMVDRDGMPFLYQTGQKIRTPRYHGTFGINPINVY